MVGHRTRGEFRTRAASRTLRVVGDVKDGAKQKRLVAESAPFAEMLVRPGEDRFQILLRERRQSILRHASFTGTAGRGFCGTSTNQTDGVGQLLFVGERDSLPLVQS